MKFCGCIHIHVKSSNFSLSSMQKKIWSDRSQFLLLLCGGFLYPLESTDCWDYIAIANFLSHDTSVRRCNLQNTLRQHKTTSYGQVTEVIISGLQISLTHFMLQSRATWSHDNLSVFYVKCGSIKVHLRTFLQALKRTILTYFQHLNVQILTYFQHLYVQNWRIDDI